MVANELDGRILFCWESPEKGSILEQIEVGGVIGGPKDGAAVIVFVSRDARGWLCPFGPCALCDHVGRLGQRLGATLPPADAIAMSHALLRAVDPEIADAVAELARRILGLPDGP